jgi:hypothetical protein
MNGQSCALSEAQSAYAMPQEIRVSEHYTGVCLTAPISVIAEPPMGDPLGFSLERLTAGQADVQAGRVHSFEDAMDALRAGVHRHRH